MGPGVRIADRYELRSLLATGGMGQVWRARDALLERDVALKVLRSEYTGDPSFLARFRAEARHTAALTHPNIATLYDYGEVDSGAGASGEHLAYLVMELVDGESLSGLLAREQRLDAGRTADLLRQTAAGLAAAHAAGVVHRDVKPGNVLVGRDGTCKLTDFGIAWSASSVPLTGTGQVMGTAHYLSPEQAQGAPATPASDVYALGLVGYECLAGRRAFDGESSVQVALKQIRELPPPLPQDVPEGMRALIGRALAKDPTQRFADGAAFRDAVEEALSGRTTEPPDRAATAVLSPAATTALSGSAAAPASSGSAAAPAATTKVLPAVTPVAGPPRGPSRRGRRLLPVLAVLAVLAVVTTVLLAQLGSFRDPAPGAASSPGGTTSAAAPPTTSAPAPAPTVPSTAEAPATIEIDADDYVERPVDEVRAELTALGLRVELRPVETDEVDAGLVVAVDPDGELAPDDLVTVEHAVAPDGGGNGTGGGGDSTGGGGNGNQGNGNGGRGEDKGKNND